MMKAYVFQLVEDKGVVLLFMTGEPQIWRYWPTDEKPKWATKVLRNDVPTVKSELENLKPGTRVERSATTLCQHFDDDHVTLDGRFTFVESFEYPNLGGNASINATWWVRHWYDKLNGLSESTLSVPV